MALSAIIPLFQTPCQLSSLASFSLALPLRHRFLFSILYPMSLSLTLCIPQCENHRGLCQLVNTTLKKAGWGVEGGGNRKKEPLHVRKTGKTEVR